MKKNINYILASIIVIILISLLYPIDQEQSKTIPKETIKVESLKEKEEPVEIVYEESIDKAIVEQEKIQEVMIPKENGFVQNIKTSNIVDKYNLEVEAKNTTLFSTVDNKNRYLISLKSSQKISSVLPQTKYIVLNGTLEHNSEKSKFSLSFNEYYKEYAYDTYIEVTNKKTNETATCDGSFLGSVSSEYRYFITLDFYGYALSCYMNSQEEDTYKKENKLKKDLNITDKKMPPMNEASLEDFFKSNQTQGNIDGNN